MPLLLLLFLLFSLLLPELDQIMPIFTTPRQIQALFAPRNGKTFLGFSFIRQKNKTEPRVEEWHPDNIFLLLLNELEKLLEFELFAAVLVQVLLQEIIPL